MKEQDFGSDKRPSAIEGIGGAIEGAGYAISEQDLGYDIRPWDRRPKDVRPWAI